MQTIKITWLSPEQPPDCQQGYAKSVIPDSEDAQRQAELIVKYRAELAQKDIEIQALRTVIAEKDAEIARLNALTPICEAFKTMSPTAHLLELLAELSRQPKENRADEDWLTERDLLDVIGLTRRWISKDAGFSAVLCVLSRMKDDENRDAWRAVGAYLGLD